MSDPSETSSDLAPLLRCPISGLPLREVASEECLKFPGEWDEGGFLSEDGQILYPIRNGFPLLVPSEATRLDSNSTSGSTPSD